MATTAQEMQIKELPKTHPTLVTDHELDLQLAALVGLTPKELLAFNVAKDEKHAEELAQWIAAEHKKMEEETSLREATEAALKARAEAEERAEAEVKAKAEAEAKAKAEAEAKAKAEAEARAKAEASRPQQQVQNQAQAPAEVKINAEAAAAENEVRSVTIQIPKAIKTFIPLFLADKMMYVLPLDCTAKEDAFEINVSMSRENEPPKALTFGFKYIPSIKKEEITKKSSHAVGI